MNKEIKCKTTKIAFGMGTVFAEKLPKLLAETTRKCVILTDSNVERAYARELEKLDCKVFSFAAGENAKTRETKAFLEDNLLAHKFGRDSLVIGLGGGVVCDVVGFLAATYCRGVPHVQIPTSLLAMVDASVGGKTGVNTPYGKNLIGAYCPPDEVWIDGAFLSTLPEDEWINGIVEILKAGLIAAPPLFEAMKERKENWQDPDFMMDRIYESVVIKRDVVEEDPEEEKGYRRILNLGHTIGHALETLEGYALPHGQAVAIGIRVSCYLSTRLGLLTQEAHQEIKEVIDQYVPDLKLPRTYPIDDIMSVLALDKKAKQGMPRFVLLSQIGQVEPFDGEYCTEVEFPLLEQAIGWMHETFT